MDMPSSHHSSEGNGTRGTTRGKGTGNRVSPRPNFRLTGPSQVSNVMNVPITLIRPYRHREQYEAKLVVDNEIIGHVERGFRQGGLGAGKVYTAWVNGTMVASGRTLSDLREELKDWYVQEYTPNKEGS